MIEAVGLPTRTARTIQSAGSLHRAFEQSVDAFAERPAIYTRTQRLTYAELNALANGLAHHIHEIAPQRSFVVTLLDDAVDILITILAISKSGCARVPLDTRLPLPMIEAILKQFDIAAIVTDKAHQELAERLRGNAPVVVLDTSAQPKIEENLRIEVLPDDPFALSFSSGSTGTPKGNLRLHAYQLESVTHQIADMRITPDDRVLCFDALNYNSAFGNIRNSIIAGARADRLELKEENAASVVDWIFSEQVTVLATIPSAFRSLFALSPAKQMPSVRLVRLSTEPALAADFQVFKETFVPGQSYFMNHYGTSEMGYVARFVADHDTSIHGVLVPVGKAIPEVELQIVDEDLKPLPRGETGEIIIRKKQMPDGYWQQPEKSEGKFLIDADDPSIHIFRTGDLGTFLPDGNLIHLGRGDAMVKIRGFRVELLEVENALLLHPQIESVTVRTISEDSVIRLAAYVVLHVGSTLSVAQIREFLSGQLPEFMIPGQFIFLEKMPLLSTGKINPAALPKPSLDTRTHDEPKTPTEKQLLPLFQNVVPVKGISREDHFFDLGGDSLKAMRLIADINSRFRIELTPSVIYRHPSIAQLGAYIDQGRPALSSLVALNPYGTQPLMLCVSGQNGNVLSFRQLVAELGHDYPLYAYQHPAYDKNAPRFDTLQDLARHFVSLASDRIKGNDYFLAGYSTGGAIVFEMAQQLTALGKPPISVIMFDAHFPSDRQGPGEREIFLEQQRREELRREPPARRMRKILYRSKQLLRRRIADLTDAKTRTIKYVKAETERNVNGYQPQPFAGKIFYLSCRQDRVSKGEPVSNAEQAWEKVALGGFELIDTAGEHSHMMEMPHVRTTARNVRHIIAETVKPAKIQVSNYGGVG